MSWNDELGVIERFFRFAVQRDLLLRSPAEKIQRRRVSKNSVDIYTPEELGLIFKHAHKDSVDYYKILLCTGMRDGEARHLRWQEVTRLRGWSASMSVDADTSDQEPAGTCNAVG